MFAANDVCLGIIGSRRSFVPSGVFHDYGLVALLHGINLFYLL